MASNHTYTTGTYNNLTLHIITTNASNIKLINLRNTSNGMSSLANSDYYGINGAWFNMSTNNRILNIAMQDGSAVGPDTSEGTGNSIGNGAIGWNGTQLSAYASVTYANEISFYDKNGTWIQGGIALWLGYGNWKNQVKSQSNASQYIESSNARTALVANMSTQKVHLIVTSDSATLSAFRGAIQSFLGISDGAQANQTYQGVMLDGNGSSQLKAKSGAATINVYGDGRNLTQIVTLRNT